MEINRDAMLNTAKNNSEIGRSKTEIYKSLQPFAI
jgi:hypothetical protein